MHRQLLEKLKAKAPVAWCKAPADLTSEQGKLEVRTFQQELEALWDEDTMRQEVILRAPDEDWRLWDDLFGDF